MAPISGKFQIVLKLVPADALGNFRDRWVRMPFIMNCHIKNRKGNGRASYKIYFTIRKYDHYGG